MSTMGIIYCNGNGTTAVGGEREQLMLLRTLQDNERNIIGNTGGNRGQVITAKNNVSVISVNQQQQLQQQQQNENNEQNSRRPNQQQGNVVLPPYDPSRLKKHGKNGQPPPIAVAKRNARERNRVKQVNNGFATLRQHIPSHVAQGYGDRGKKLSKVETLRMAVEYIRGLQRLLAEADGLDYDSISSSNQNQTGDSVMIPSPSGSVYSNGTHNGSGDVLGLGGSELDEQHSAGPDNGGLDEDMDGESYLVEEDDEEDENRDRRDVKRFRDDGRSQNRLSENHNRDRLLSSVQRRRRNSPSTFYVSRSASSFGDEENVEPLTPRNNNSSQHNNNNNNNHLLSGYTPILLQSSSPTNDGLPSIKREICLSNEEKLCSEDDSTHGGVILASPSPYTGEILIENPETGRLVPLKLEDPEAAGAQLVYLSAEGLPTSTYYKHDVADGAANGTEFMDVVNWWEQEQGRFVHHLQGHHHHHHHHAPQHQQTHQQAHQQLAVQQRLAHV